MHRNPLGLVGAIAIACVILGGPAQAQSVEEFYRGRQMQLLIGFPVAERLRHLWPRGRPPSRQAHPGNPTVIPVNRPGAGSLTAANFLYNGAPKDGATIAHFNRSVPLEPLMGNAAGASFDGPQIQLARQRRQRGQRLRGLARRDGARPGTTLSPRILSRAPPAYGADTGVFPLVLKNVFGAKIKIITGYPGGGEMKLAMENGEIDGRCGWSWSGVKSSETGLARRQADQLCRCSSACRRAPNCPTSR